MFFKTRRVRTCDFTVVQNVKFNSEMVFMVQSKMFWIDPKQGPKSFWTYKGQLISKAIYGLLTSPKKQTNKFVFLS